MGLKEALPLREKPLSKSQKTYLSRPRWIHFWLFGPEFGCVKRELPIIEKLRLDFKVLLIVHNRHVAPMRQYFASDKNIEIVTYHQGINLEYNADLTIKLGKTLANAIKFVAYQWIRDFRIFRNAIKTYPPAVIVSDFLPYIPLWSRIHRIPTIGVYNFSLDYTSFGNALTHKILEFIVTTAYKISYRFPNKMFIESLVEREIPHARCIPLIRRYSTPADERDSEGNYFIALGGKSNPELILQFFKKVHKFAPQLKFWLALREGGEFTNMNSPFNIVSTDSAFSTCDMIQKMDGVITKAGFSTVAEALQFKKKIYTIMLKNHPEIQETANALIAMGLTKPISLAMPPEEVAAILTAPFEAGKNAIKFGGEKIVLKEIQKHI